MGCDHADRERRGQRDRVDTDDAGEPAGLGGIRPPAAGAQYPPRAEDVATVEERDRYQVDQVEEEAGVGERAQQVGVGRAAVDETGQRTDPAGRRSGRRDERVLPRIERLVTERDVRTEEGDEDGQLRVEPLPLAST